MKGRDKIPAVILKQRCFNPNNPKTAVSNSEHIRYIATRNGVLVDEGMTHGLFGKAFGMQAAGNIENFSEFRRQVKDISEERTIIHRCIVSLKEADAIRKGFDERISWEKEVKKQIPYIAEVMNIPVSKLEWCAAVHMDKNHPHIHLLYWEREQGVRRPFIHAAQSNKLRGYFTKSIFAEELAQFYEEKELSQKELDTAVSSVLADELSGLKDISSEEYKKLLAEIKATDLDLGTPKLIYNKVSPKKYSELFDSLLELKMNLPTKGRLAYGYLSTELKVQTDRVTDLILKLSTDCKREVARYVSAAVSVTALYTDSEKTLDMTGSDAETELYRKVGNQILKSLKKIDGDRWTHNREAYKAFVVQQILSDVYRLLTALTDKQQSGQGYLPHGELSKQAKKEFSKRNKGVEDEYGR